LLKVDVELDCEVSAIELHELEVTPPKPGFDHDVELAVAAARKGKVADTRGARELYRRFGLDPTRHRPSSEALLRRVLRGDEFPRINSLVDIANVLSLRLQVPVGLYDLAHVRDGRLKLRLGRPGEAYTGIGKERVNVSGRICVADAEGPCGNPSSDSRRTMITTSTESAAWIYFLPVPHAALEQTAQLVAMYGRGLVRIA
jgi:DNA/RNA-binding domain of Phe-tRNA-synthetase-like protein